MRATKKPYSFVVLRYMHDVFTREFVNVGVLLHAPCGGFIGFEKLQSLERVKAMFPGVRSRPLRELLAFLAARAEEIRRMSSELLDRDRLSAETIAKSLLPPDDSALQWSGPGGGVTDDPQQTLRELFQRLVARHLKAHPPTRRVDADVWKPFERELRQRNVLSRLQEKTLSVGELRHRFKTAWQPPGSYLRLLQPLSFDLVDPSEIVEKAVHWDGLITQFRRVEPDFHIWLLIGQPGDKRRTRAFDQAYKTLAEGSQRRELVAEADAPRFADDVAKQIEAVPNN